jgi:TolA-binding protein
MDTVTYPEGKVAEFLNREFVPARISVKEADEAIALFKPTWTPTLLCLDPEGGVHYRTVGFVPPDEFVPEFRVARSLAAFDQGQYAAAKEQFATVLRETPHSVHAPQAQYWHAVAEYKQSGSRDALIAGWKTLKERYPESYWAKKLPL